MSSCPSTAADAFRTTLDLFETGLELMRQTLRRRYPDASDEEVEDRLGRWLRERPGAEWGDAPGRRVEIGSGRR